MESPAVSVIMTVYNTRNYLARAIRSVLKQTWRDLELILVDDGSSDGSLGVIQRMAAADGRVRVISRPNTGIVQASNDGLAVARGRYIARMDSDDISLPTRLERQMAFAAQHPEIVASSGWYDYMDEKGRRLVTMRMPTGDDEIQKSCLEGIPALCHGCVLIRHDALRAIGGYDTAFARATEDLDLFLRLGEVGPLANIPEVILQVRLHDRSFGGRQRVIQLEMAKVACERAWTRRGVRGEFKPTSSWRPGQDGDSQYQFLLRCGWWAFNSRERRTAMIYGAKAVAKRPAGREGWRLLACAAIKTGREPE